MAKLYLQLFPFVPFAPILIVGLGIAFSLRQARRRWPINILVFVALLSTLPVYLYIQGLVDPTTIDHPGSGDGFVALLYLLILAPMALGYSVFAWLISRPGPNDNTGL
jgi:hypothetical protein